jgi:hypothetical protein
MADWLPARKQDFAENGRRPRRHHVDFQQVFVRIADNTIDAVPFRSPFFDTLLVLILNISDGDDFLKIQPRPVVFVR